MNINALLSSDDSTPPSLPSSGNTPRSPQKTRTRPALSAGKRTSSSLSQEIRLSPERSVPASPTSLPPPPTSLTPQHHQQYQQYQHGHQQQPALVNVLPGVIAAPNFRPLPTSYPVADPPPPQNPYGHVPGIPPRPPVASYRSTSSSAAQVETLTAGGGIVPSLQSHQQLQSTTPDLPPPYLDVPSQTRQQTPRTNSGSSVHQQRSVHSPLTCTTTAAPALARSISRQSLADITMAEAPAQTPPPRDFTSAALSDVDSKTVTDLLSHLTENSYAYDQHVELINLLHKGFLAHVYPPSENDEPAPPGDPYSYTLLAELRQARDAMDTRFAVGEEIWIDWLSDEMVLARSSEERIDMTELCQKAVQDEPASVKLWKAYVDWVSTNYAECNDLEGTDDRNWNAEDKELCKGLFSRGMLLTVVEQAIRATKWRIDESHIIWNRYAQLFQEGFPEAPSDIDVKRLHALFMERLQVPHVAHQETMQLFWPIISRFEGANWEGVIARVNRAAESAKFHANLRGDWEAKLQRAMQTGDKESIRREFERYLKSEKFHHKKSGPFDHELRCALYERALLIFPTATDWWLDYVDFAVTSDPVGSRSLLPLVERATRHCPWSGDLWARRILRADVEQQPREDIEHTKHRATNAGLLDVGGMEELVKMLQQWCSFLRRHAFHPNATEDDVDTAEVGITMALEDVQQAGQKLHGETFQGDPLFRLERIQIKFYSEARRFNDAREIYRQLASQQATSSDFWSQYYSWELWLWGYDRVREPRRVETDDNGPDHASAVAREALSQRNLDWPEKVLEMYLAHFQQHESGTKLQQALADARDFSNRLVTKRAKEAEEAAALASQHQEQLIAATRTADEAPSNTSGKRKRNEDPLINGDGYKKAKTDEVVPSDDYMELSAAGSTQTKRDREHNTITVKGLHADVQEDAVKKFFRDCGKILSLNFLPNKEDDTATVTVEFEAQEDVLAAMTRSGRELDGCEMQIQRGGQTTLYVANYPPHYDEQNIRDLFKAYGEIVSVRLPSLKFDSRRRFCYVQFLTAEMARAAEAAMDEKKIDKKHTLLARISNPDAKKSRSGAQAEGREIIAKNIDRNADEKEVKDFFSQYGRLEKCNLLRLVNNKLTGTGFFVYASIAEAHAAVAGANNAPFHDRILHVEISNAKGRAAPDERARKEDINIKHSATPDPDPRHNGSEFSTTDETSAETAKARKIAIFNLPDTVNDTRIRAAMEAFGPIVKIQLRREKSGAIVEFADLKTAFHVRQGVDVSGLGPEAETGDVVDLLKKGKKGPPASSALAFVPPAASRGGGARGGRRGGLGFRSRGGGGIGFGGGASRMEAGGEGKKSNSDFRSMLEASKKPVPKKNEEEDAT